jgi:hypothetical protein
MSHLDDLPERTDDHVGETENREAFRASFKDPYFLIREEQERDYGVDYVVEAIAQTKWPTNIRFHAQLKASTGDANKDGSFSYSVERTNLNYLLNSPRSVYVFFSREKKTLFYAWAEEVYAEYEKSGKDWHSQDSVTVRFKNVVDEAALKQINEEVVAEATRERDRRLLMVKQGGYMIAAFHYDPAIEKVTDVTALLKLLASSGLALAAHGHAQQVLAFGDQVPPASLTAEVRLALAYAAYMLGRHATAMDYVRMCTEADFADGDRKALLALLEPTLRRSMVLLSDEQLLEAVRQVERTYPDSVPTIYARLERLRREGLRGDDAAPSEAARKVVESLQARGPSWAALAAQATFVWLELRFHLLQHEVLEQVTMYRMTEAMGIADKTADHRAAGAVMLGEDYRAWLKEFETALEVADGLKLDLVLAEGLYLYETCTIQDTLLSDKFVASTPDLAKGRREKLQRSLARLDLAAKKFHGAHAIEQELRAKMAAVEVWWLLDKKDEARKLAAHVAAGATETGLPELLARATAIVAGESPVAPFDALPSMFE